MENKFVWTEEYSVKNKMIDEQHQTFFAITNELIAVAENAAAGKGAVLDEATKLGDYAFYHLGTEEEMFKQYDYPEAAEHIAAHNAFREKAKELIDGIRGGDPSDVRKLAEDAAEFSGKWLMNHIRVMDQRYSDFFTEKGLS